MQVELVQPVQVQLNMTGQQQVINLQPCIQGTIEYTGVAGAALTAYVGLQVYYEMKPSLTTLSDDLITQICGML
jgi:hypothetical protein